MGGAVEGSGFAAGGTDAAGDAVREAVYDFVFQAHPTAKLQ